jgi:hypothetical protein
MAGLILLVLLLWLLTTLWKPSKPCPSAGRSGLNVLCHPELDSGSIWLPIRKAKGWLLNQRAPQALRAQAAERSGHDDGKRVAALLASHLSL